MSKATNFWRFVGFALLPLPMIYFLNEHISGFIHIHNTKTKKLSPFILHNKIWMGSYHGTKPINGQDVKTIRIIIYQTIYRQKQLLDKMTQKPV